MALTNKRINKIFDRATRGMN